MTVIDSLLYYYNTISGDTLATDSTFIKPVVVPETILPMIQRSPFIHDWTIVVIILTTILIATVVVSSEKYMIHLIQATFNRQTAARLYRERVNNFLHPSFRLEIIFYLSAGLICSQLAELLFPHLHLKSLQTYLLSVLFIVVFINVKFILYTITGFLFNVQSEIEEYAYYMRSGNRVLGLFMFPIAVLVLFFEHIGHEILLILALLIALLVSAIRLFNGIKINTQKDFSIYYLILYLCSLEILPLLIVWKILQSI